MSDTKLLPLDVRLWPYYPIEMPLTEDNFGPATVGKDADKISYEVWDRDTFQSQAVYDNLPDAINEAMRLSILELTPNE